MCILQTSRGIIMNIQSKRQQEKKRHKKKHKIHGWNRKLLVMIETIVMCLIQTQLYQ